MKSGSGRSRIQCLIQIIPPRNGQFLPIMKTEDSRCQEGIAQVRVIPLKSPCKVMKEQEFF